MEDNFDSRYANDTKKDMDDVIKQAALLLRDDEVQAQFNGYYYDYTVPISQANTSQLRDCSSTNEPNSKKEPDYLSANNLQLIV